MYYIQMNQITAACHAVLNSTTAVPLLVQCTYNDEELLSLQPIMFPPKPFDMLRKV